MTKELSSPLISEHDENTKKRCVKCVDYANGIIFGFGLGGLFFFTSLAGVSKIIPNPVAGVILGSITGIFDAITNATLTMSATRDLFRFRPLLWAATAIAFLTIGLPSGLPFVAASMQSTEEIYNITGIDIRVLTPVFGNVSSLLYGILNSMGIASLFVNAISLMIAKYSTNESYIFTQIQRYLLDQRSPAEYERIIESPTLKQFIRDKFSPLNLLAMLVSLSAFGYDYAVSGELPLALNGTEEPFIAKSIGFGGLIPIADFARTDVGSKVITCAAAGPLHATFMATSIRALSRDIKNSACNLKEAGLTFIFLIGIVLTAVTPIFEAIEGSGEISMSVVSFLAALFVNYSGPRPIFNRFFRKKSAEVTLGNKSMLLLKDTYSNNIKHNKSCCLGKKKQEDQAEFNVPELP